ncbi:hypothetical protein GO755_10565 [Spirosoma sp. HMF4905]|uniref:Uncharacterized protein n=1 Tax=Spirosoma arboris TaxID=2682092 RepID=A0A7K1S9I6_9BACT|nr:hypothetical protein [Spirosoma arboris]MVM30477.1 hypothetical protein [Spirosoma arboris]
MNTEQSYSGKGKIMSLTPQTAKKAAQISLTDDNRAERNIYIPNSAFSGDFLLAHDIPKHEHSRTYGFLVLDNSMAPLINAGYRVLMVAMPSSYFPSAKGVVTVCTKSKPDIFIIGRVKAISGGKIYLDRTNAESVALSLSELDSLCELRSFYGGKIQ